MSGEKENDSKKGWVVTGGGVLFCFAVVSFSVTQYSNFEKRVEQRFEIDRRISDVERIVAELVNEDVIGRLDDAERVTTSIIAKDIFNRIDINERKSDQANQWTLDWEQSGELPVDREQNRQIQEAREELNIVHRGINVICYGLRDREPADTKNKWPPCEEISRVRP